MDEVVAYSLHSWEIILGEHAFQAVPQSIRLLAPLAFSMGVVVTVHTIAGYLKDRHFPRWAWGAIILLLAGFAVMATAGRFAPLVHGTP